MNKRRRDAIDRWTTKGLEANDRQWAASEAYNDAVDHGEPLERRLILRAAMDGALRESYRSTARCCLLMGKVIRAKGWRVKQ